MKCSILCLCWNAVFAASADFLTTGLGWIVPGVIKERTTLEPNTLLVSLSILTMQLSHYLLYTFTIILYVHSYV